MIPIRFQQLQPPRSLLWPLELQPKIYTHILKFGIFHFFYIGYVFVTETLTKHANVLFVCGIVGVWLEKLGKSMKARKSIEAKGS